MFGIPEACGAECGQPGPDVTAEDISPGRTADRAPATTTGKCLGQVTVLAVCV